MVSFDKGHKSSFFFSFTPQTSLTILSKCDKTLATVRDIGKGILAEKNEIRAFSKAGVEIPDVDKEVTQSCAKKQCSRAKKCSCKWHNKTLKQSYEKYNCDFSETESLIKTKLTRL